MPTLDAHPSSKIIKLLNIGESGSGKTGALASLVKVGYSLYVLDFDNGLDILANLLTPDEQAHVTYESLRDEMTMSRGVPKVKNPTAWKGAGEALDKWNAYSLGPSDIIVLDTLSTASQAAFNWALLLNPNNLQAVYGGMADTVLAFIDMLTASPMNCNVIVNTHVRFLAGEGDATSLRGLPNAKGQQIPKDIGKFFNTCVLTRTMGTGPGARRLISTKPQGMIEVKTSNPLSVKDTYTLESGLAELFADILGHGPEAANRKGGSPNAPSTQLTPTATEEKALTNG